MSLARFDAILFDAGGVLVLPDPTVLAPLLAPYGGSSEIAAHRRAHYAGMANKSRFGAQETSWGTYDRAYVEAVGVDREHREHATVALHKTRTGHLWRWPIPESVAALAVLSAAKMPMGVVSNADGQIEAELRRSRICHTGEGPGVTMRCVIDSAVVGFTKPDPRIFEVALSHFAEFDRSRIAYVGDSVTIDVVGATSAGLHPILVDPFNDHSDGDFERIESLADLLG